MAKSCAMKGGKSGGGKGPMMANMSGGAKSGGSRPASPAPAPKKRVKPRYAKGD